MPVDLNSLSDDDLIEIAQQKGIQVPGQTREVYGPQSEGEQWRAQPFWKKLITEIPGRTPDTSSVDVPVNPFALQPMAGAKAAQALGGIAMTDAVDMAPLAEKGAAAAAEPKSFLTQYLEKQMQPEPATELELQSAREAAQRAISGQGEGGLLKFGGLLRKLGLLR